MVKYKFLPVAIIVSLPIFWPSFSFSDSGLLSLERDQRPRAANLNDQAAAQTNVERMNVIEDLQVRHQDTAGAPVNVSFTQGPKEEVAGPGDLPALMAPEEVTGKPNNLPNLMAPENVTEKPIDPPLLMAPEEVTGKPNNLPNLMAPEEITEKPLNPPFLQAPEATAKKPVALPAIAANDIIAKSRMYQRPKSTIFKTKTSKKYRRGGRYDEDSLFADN